MSDRDPSRADDGSRPGDATGDPPDEGRRAPSIERERMRAAIEERLLGAEPAPIRAGRFVLLDVLGRGGMGIVYRAFDPTLERMVALKVMSARGPVATARLVREAKALARLADPNVVTVHEVVEENGQVCVAMELVDGVPLDQWCADHPVGTRGRTRILVGFLRQAAAGLAAAHRAGIIHRDLKPANILVGRPQAGARDGASRVRLADFGLARTADENPVEAASAEQPPRPPKDERLTATGNVLGTPAYMAPEQLDGTQTTRSDQFSLCAAFFDALYGTPPFAASNMDELVTRLAEGAIVQPRRGDVPRYLHRVLERGLARRPEDRFADIEGLLHALDQGRRRRVMVVWGSALAVAAVATVPFLPTLAPCEASADELDRGWGSERKAAVRRAVLESTAPFAESTWERLEARLDTAAAQWVDSDLEACRAQRDPDPEVADRAAASAACLRQAAAALDIFTATLSEASRDEVAHALTAADDLQSEMDCRHPSHVDSEHAREVARAVTAAGVAASFGRLDEAERHARLALESSAPGELPHLRMRAHAHLAAVHFDRHDSEDLYVEERRAALDEAERSADPRLLVDAWGQLATVAARRGEAETTAFRIARLQRVVHGADLPAYWRAQAKRAESRAVSLLGRTQDAVAPLGEAVALARERPESDRVLAELLGEYFQALMLAGRHDAAVTAGEKAIEHMRRAVGDDHPAFAFLRGRVGWIYHYTGDDGRAIRELEAALDVLEANPVYRPQTRARFATSLAQLLHRDGRVDEATALLEKAVQEVEATFGPDSAELASPLMSRGQAHEIAGDPEAALRDYDRAIGVLTGKSADDRLRRGQAELRRAALLAQLHRPGEAMAALEPARAELLTLLSGPPALDIRERVARILGVLDDKDEAVEVLREGIEQARRSDLPEWVTRLEALMAQLETPPAG